MDRLFKLIIVEDEDNIRNGLAHVVKWRELGYVMVNSFNNAEDAMSYIGENQVDVVLSDICLPKSSGIDLANWIKSNNWEIKVLILSGYSSFEYAQSAIDAHVYKYMLKPTEPRKFMHVFMQLYQDLITSEESYKHKMIAKQYSLASILRMMIRGEVDNKKISWFSMIAFGRYVNTGWLLCNLSCSDMKDDMATLFYNIFEGHNDFCIIPVCYGLNLLILAMPLEKGDINVKSNLFNQEIEKSIDIFSILMGIRLSIITYDFGNEFSDIEDSLMKSSDGLKSDIAFHSEQKSIHIAETIKHIEKLELDILKKNIKNMDQDVQQNVGLLLLYRLNSIVKDAKSQENLIDRNEYEQILHENDKVLLNHINDILYRIEKTTNHSLLGYVEKACDYIEQQQGHIVTLKEVALHVHLSPVYLSKIFKEQKKNSFKKYTTDNAIKFSKKLLLETDYKVYDIALRIGYKDVRNFYTVFEKYVGLTPTQYRQNHKIS